MVASALFLLVPWLGTNERGVSNSGESAGLSLGTWQSQLDRALLLLWLSTTLVLLVKLLVARRSLKRESRAWRSVEVDGTAVMISDDVGPGVTIFGRPHIVLPAWIFELQPTARALLIDHEREHIRARDHWCLAAGLGILLLFPINPFLWWQFTRLKLAIEMDCDARVLSGRQDVRRYAALLLDVGQRCRAGRLVFAAFAAPPHAIERRIRMMLDPKPGARWLAALCAAGAVAGVILACQTPEPSAPDVAVREALGILPAPPPPPPAPPAPEAGEVSGEQVGRLRQVADVVDGLAYKVTYTAGHPIPKKVDAQRLHSKLKEVPPPPPPPPRPRS
jgi:beta-lactamase regulating signal transducer with metallopeptidase domain